MAPKADPWDFQDVYRQVGAEGFVKKTMAEQRSQAPATQPAAAAASRAPGEAAVCPGWPPEAREARDGC